ncbi:ABC-type cobalamin/Fe3+-siderophores transport system, ATPase component [Ruegeria sp. ANG-R]|uniref:esterase-like activity of phytase family protein n=1 Tax=Ruegeria sp. ANG-R TaxID=1577903 RepID=UPI00057F919E|nr:esterase-like activity of phytase family protein [Ruegeria sp. ANG-R]KIC38632.1 ABC-type cobalamin/Fe3+-siderophores transport system, ATPase component [Ruegeria sp. ANG-R]
MHRRSAVQLISALLLAGPVQAVEARAASLLGSYNWSNRADWFGGFSAIHISENGQHMIAVSDRSKLVTARIERDGDKISDVRILGHWPILSSRGAALRGRAGDSEGLAIAADGSLYISFERIHRVVHYAAPDARARVLPRPQAFLNLDQNGSFEALAIDDRGRLYTLAEKSRTAQGAIPVFRWDGSRWSAPFVLPARGSFLPVAADFGPDGRLYVLERAVSLIGFRSRLRRWVIDDGVPQAEEILFETGTGKHDNLEGLSVWRDMKGRLRATMVSDDNFFALQRTELVEYLLPD